MFVAYLAATSGCRITHVNFDALPGKFCRACHIAIRNVTRRQDPMTPAERGSSQHTFSYAQRNPITSPTPASERISTQHVCALTGI